MPSRVYFADMRAGREENLFAKIGKLLHSCGLADRVAPGDLVAVKVHFGEKGNHTFIRPVFLRKVVEEIKSCQGKPFLTDSVTLYPGSRKEAVSALTCAIENGFAYAVVGAPLVMSDGLRGHTAVEVQIKGEIFRKVEIGAEVVEADALVAVSHFKCHGLTGFGGALKNLGMGCSSRKGKLMQHSSVAPEVVGEFCTGCEACLASCAHGALSIGDGKARINPEKCAGCGRCISVCRQKAIKIKYNSTAPLVMKKMCEFALGAIRGKEKKSIYLNFITQVSPDCDCFSHADAPIVNDIGICASTDPVALDQACADLVNAAQGNHNTALGSGFEPGGDKFRGVHPDIDWEIQLEHAEKIGVGNRSYELVRIAL
jgi:uncharacterized Fe-S center protein